VSKKDRAAEAAAATAFEAASSASVVVLVVVLSSLLLMLFAAEDEDEDRSRFASSPFPWIDTDGGDRRALVRTSIAAVLRLWALGAIPVRVPVPVTAPLSKAAAIISKIPFCSSMVNLDEK
jgi:hypothetical protein